MQTRTDFYTASPDAMKAMLALAAAWIAFYLADQALYDGRHVFTYPSLPAGPTANSAMTRKLT